MEEGANLNADTHCEVRDADGKAGCDSPALRLPGGAGEQKIYSSPSASLFSGERQFPIIFCQRPISINSDFSTLFARVSTFVYPYENEFLKVIASVLHSARCSLAEGVINGSSLSVCSRQALLLSLPPRATRTLLTPRRNRRICGCALPVGKKMRRRGGGERRRNGRTEVGKATVS